MKRNDCCGMAILEALILLPLTLAVISVAVILMAVYGRSIVITGGAQLQARHAVTAIDATRGDEEVGKRMRHFFDTLGWGGQLVSEPKTPFSTPRVMRMAVTDTFDYWMPTKPAGNGPYTEWERWKWESKYVVDAAGQGLAMSETDNNIY